MPTISIKDLRHNLSAVADRVLAGEVLTVFRHSQPAFKIVPADSVLDDAWEAVIDFTDGDQREGEALDLVIKALENKA